MKSKQFRYVYYVDYDTESTVEKIKRLLGLELSKTQWAKLDQFSGGIVELLIDKFNRENIKFINYKDANPAIEPDVVLHFDLPKNYKEIINDKWSKSRHILCLQECEVIKPYNWNLTAHGLFDKVLTWNTELISLKKYTHIYSIQGFNGDKDLPIKLGMSHKKNLVSLVCSNKVSAHPKELYSERLKCIKWFEKFHQEEFDLYGYGWNSLPSGANFIIKIIKNIPPISRRLAKKYKVYKGFIENKRETLEQYKFNISFENAHSVPGYITDKIFDSFISGTIPVYLGAPNVSVFIPEDCYVDMSKFDSYDKLYDFMLNISEEEYLAYQIRIKNFLESSKGQKYTYDYYACIVHDNILQLVN